MDFLLYLTTNNLEIYNLIKNKIIIQSNSRICRSNEIFGWYDSIEKRLSICVDRINTYEDPIYRINETFLHEVVHYAQSCKTGGKYIAPFGISTSNMPLKEHQKNELESSVKYNGSNVRQLEHEAFWMENKPDKVKYVVKKYCL